MSLLSYERYVSLTGDSTTASAAVEAAIVDAEQAVSEALRRPLEYGDYTDTLRIDVDGLVYPKAIPVASVPASAEYQIVEHNALGFFATGEHPRITEWSTELRTGYLVDQPRRTVSYTGGWTPGSAPFALLRTIARVAQRLAAPVPLEAATPGATSVRVGDLGVTYGPGGATGDATGRDLLEAVAPGAWASIADLVWTEDYA